MVEQLTALRGWRFDVAMVLLIVAGVVVVHSLFRLGDWLLRTRRTPERRKDVSAPDATRVQR